MLGVSFEDLTHRVDRVVGDNTGHGVFLFFVDLVQKGFDDLGADQRGEHVDVGLFQADFVEDCFGCFPAVFVEELGDVDDFGILVFFVVDQNPVTDEFVGVIQGQTPGGWQSVGRRGADDNHPFVAVHEPFEGFLDRIPHAQIGECF